MRRLKKHQAEAYSELQCAAESFELQCSQLGEGRALDLAKQSMSGALWWVRAYLNDFDVPITHKTKLGM